MLALVLALLTALVFASVASGRAGAGTATATRSISGEIVLTSDGRSQLAQRVWVSVATLSGVEVARVRVHRWNVSGRRTGTRPLPRRFCDAGVGRDVRDRRWRLRRDGTTIVDVRQRSVSSARHRISSSSDGFGDSDWGSVWIDVNGNDSADADDRPAVGSWIILEDGAGKELDRTITDDSGRFVMHDTCVCRTTDPQLWLRVIARDAAASGRTAVPVGSMSMTAAIPLVPNPEPTTTTASSSTLPTVRTRNSPPVDTVDSGAVTTTSSTVTAVSAADRQTTTTQGTVAQSTSTLASRVKDQLPTEWLVGSPPATTTVRVPSSTTTTVFWEKQSKPCRRPRPR
ncbi:MAG: hypothetical protein H6512_00810 [Acidimicrobiia bacterium]|nr:hypothetical protein [Acidimicrobiia bacterium]